NTLLFNSANIGTALLIQARTRLSLLLLKSGCAGVDRSISRRTREPASELVLHKPPKKKVFLIQPVINFRHFPVGGIDFTEVAGHPGLRLIYGRIEPGGGRGKDRCPQRAGLFGL